jgi:hypothetical protein
MSSTTPQRCRRCWESDVEKPESMGNQPVASITRRFCVFGYSPGAFRKVSPPKAATKDFFIIKREGLQFAIVVQSLTGLYSFAHWSCASLIPPQAALGSDSPLPLNRNVALVPAYTGPTKFVAKMPRDAQICWSIAGRIQEGGTGGNASSPCIEIYRRLSMSRYLFASEQAAYRIYDRAYY